MSAATAPHILALLQADFADEWVMGCLSLQDAASVEAAHPTVRHALLRGWAWSRCALDSLRPQFELQSLPWPRCRADVREVVTTLRGARPQQAKVVLRSLKQACSLAKAINHVRRRADANPAEGGFLPALTVTTFFFAGEGLGGRPRPRRMWVSSPAVVDCSVGAKGGATEAWSVQMAWHHSGVLLRAMPAAPHTGGEAQRRGTAALPTPPVLDIQAVSDSVVLRAHAVQMAPKGCWTKVAGLCFLAGNTTNAAKELGEGLVCVVCARDPWASTAQAPQAPHVHALHLAPFVDRVWLAAAQEPPAEQA